MRRARGFGLAGVRTQVKLTAIAVNLKRIANILIEIDKATNSGKDIAHHLYFLVKTAFCSLQLTILRKSAVAWNYADFQVNNIV
jgi:uncharacterized membrane protein YidH (DUF202 family)